MDGAKAGGRDKLPLILDEVDRFEARLPEVEHMCGNFGMGIFGFPGARLAW
jgi:hypothetical protein